MAPRSSSHSPGPSLPPTLGKHHLDRLPPSRVKSTLPSRLEWEEERTLMLTLAQRARYMQRPCWLSSILKPRLPSLEYSPLPVLIRTFLTILLTVRPGSLIQPKLIAHGLHPTERTSTFPTTTRVPAQRFTFKDQMTMVSPSTEHASRHAAKPKQRSTR